MLIMKFQVLICLLVALLLANAVDAILPQKVQTCRTLIASRTGPTAMRAGVDDNRFLLKHKTHKKNQKKKAVYKRKMAPQQRKGRKRVTLMSKKKRCGIVFNTPYY